MIGMTKPVFFRGVHPHQTKRRRFAELPDLLELPELPELLELPELPELPEFLHF